MKKVFLFCIVLALVMVSCKKEPEIKEESVIKLEKLNWFVKGTNSHAEYCIGYPKNSTYTVDIHNKNNSSNDYTVNDVNVKGQCKESETIYLCFQFVDETENITSETKDKNIKYPEFYITDKENKIISYNTKKERGYAYLGRIYNEIQKVHSIQITVDYSIFDDLWDYQVFEYNIHYGFEAGNYKNEKIKICLSNINRYESDYKDYEIKIDEIKLNSDSIKFSEDDKNIKLSEIEINENDRINIDFYYNIDWSKVYDCDYEKIDLFINDKETPFIQFIKNYKTNTGSYVEIFETYLSKSDFNSENKCEIKLKTGNDLIKQFIIEK